MELVLIFIYGGFLSFILLYSIVQLNLVILYRKSKKNEKPEDLIAPAIKDEDLPMITIQLPIYNELYVIERLIDACARFDYPRDKYEIQILDDSTDETVELVAAKVLVLKAEGLNIEHIQRPDRVGYKAGALRYGMEICKGEFIAIFDADFIPVPEFLRKTVPWFYSDDKIGVVQTKWTHINQEYSMLTRLQAVGLDAHFTVEQQGRNQGRHFINFNGTAGIWRRKTIEDAGGWQADTITEDLDLSYRAQLKGWVFKYLEDVGSPAELPAEMNALKSQQFRWSKGAAECTVKNLPRVIRAKGVPFGTKVHAIFHLMNSFVFVCILMSALLSIPLLFIKNDFQQYGFIFQLASLYIISFIFLSLFYWTSLARDGDRGIKGFWKFLKYFPFFLAVSMGLSLHNSIAVFEGYVGRKTPFVRTPKFNINTKDDKWQKNKYIMPKLNFLTVVEGLMVVYFLWGIFMGFKIGDYGMMPFHTMLVFGFGFIFFYTLKHSRT
jgi:cellulose synthase/poly-beta-1,6-N-acetylglucosamine synthase-like glycosyltransferase